MTFEPCLTIARIYIYFKNCRLPIVQGGDYGYLAPTFAIMALPQWTCPIPEGQFQWSC